MKRQALSFVIACLSSVLVSLGVVIAILPGSRESLRQVLLTTQVIGLGVAVTYPLVFLPVFVVLGRRAPRLRRVSAAMAGALLSLVTFLWTAWALEGFEYGLRSLLRDPGTWLFLLAQSMGGVAFGLVWHARWAGERPEPAGGLGRMAA